MDRRRTGARPPLRGHADIAASSVLFLLALATLHMSPQQTDAWSAGAGVLSAVIAGLLPVAHRRPVPALATMTGMFLIAQAYYGLIPVFALIVVAAVFASASTDLISRRSVTVTALLIAVVVDASAELTRHDSWTDSAYLVMATAVLGAATAGDAVRSRRAYVHEIEDRARRAEQSREQAVQQRIAEERLTIARDVHDLVAHQLAVINVQAEVAVRLIDSRPAVAREALGQIRQAAGSALGELGSLLNILRHASQDHILPVEPSPNLAQLPKLMASFETIGLQIRRSEHGISRPLPPAVELAAYRLVQESLTNAHKHGSGRAELGITYSDDHLVIDVVNATDSSAAMATAAGGHGLLGMRERVSALGGTLRVDDTAPGRFHVRASLPSSALSVGRA